MQLTKPTMSLFAEDFELMKAKLSSDEIVAILSGVSDLCIFGETNYQPETKTQTYFWDKVKDKFDYDLRAYKASIENGKKGAKYGALGGRPKKQKTPEETPSKTPSKTPNKTPSCHLSLVNNISPISPSGDISPLKEKFSKPSIEEIRSYCQEKGLSVDPQAFFDYFEVGDWKDAKGHKVKNWKQKILTWQKFESTGEKNKPKESVWDYNMRIMREMELENQMEIKNGQTEL